MTSPAPKPLSKTVIDLIAEAQEVPIEISSDDHDAHVVMRLSLFEQILEDTDYPEEMPYKHRAHEDQEIAILTRPDFDALKAHLDKTVREQRITNADLPPDLRRSLLERVPHLFD